MRRFQTLTAACAVALAGAAPAFADHHGGHHGGGERAAVLAAIDAFFEAFTARDEAGLRANMQSDGHVIVLRDRGEEGWVLTKSTTEATIQNLSQPGARLEEPYWNPTVLIRGPMAVVWAPYEVTADGELVHCGVDSFDMVKQDGKWMIAGIMYTAEPQACDEIRAMRD